MPSDVSATSKRASARLSVLASGSGGNSSLVEFRAPGIRRVVLIDMGLSPRRTKQALHEHGLKFEEITDVVITHFDQDHWRRTWSAKPWIGPTLRLHRRHVRRAERAGALNRRSEPFGDAFELAPGFEVRVVLNTHDDLGSAAFRFDFGGLSLGYATDLGHTTDPLIELMHGVDALAIESNYCPRLQAASPRPEYLKRRIMGGRGHLSNEQCRDAINAIQPRSHVVLLHLSRQCNTPELASSYHAGAPYQLTLSNQHVATGWIALGEAVPPVAPVPESVLFARSAAGDWEVAV